MVDAQHKHSVASRKYPSAVCISISIEIIALGSTDAATRAGTTWQLCFSKSSLKIVTDFGANTRSF